MRPCLDWYETLYILAAVALGMAAPACFMLASIEGLPATLTDMAPVCGVLALMLAGFLASMWPAVQGSGKELE